MIETKDSSQSSYNIEDYYIVACLSSGFSSIAIIICIMILILIYRSKSRRLHTIQHLLMCNTCLASIFSSLITIINYIFFIYRRDEINDMNCRWRAYFAYIGIAGVLYSYMIQAISRFLICILSMNYRWLITFPTHYILISLQWLIVCLITLSSLLTKDIVYHPQKLCFIPMRNTLHVVCAILAYYIIPLLITILIYLYIYYRTVKRHGVIIHLKRNLRVLRNIVILISIYIGGGLPSIIYFITPTKYPYLINLVTQSLAVTLATLCTIVLDRELRQVMRSYLCRSTRVQVFHQTQTTRRIQQNIHYLQSCF